MFCYQCEQAFRGSGCVDLGVCGKEAPVSDLQDLLIQLSKEVGWYAHRARLRGAADAEADVFALEALFATGTNVNFDPDRLESLLLRGTELRDRLRTLAGGDCAPCSEPGIRPRLVSLGDDIAGLQELITYGLKGAAAYAEHARQLGREDDAVYASLHEILGFLAEPSPAVDELVAMALKTGELNHRAMELLDAANTETFGHPEPASVRVEPRKGKALLVSGHDLADLYAILVQTEGKGINVYTHGELLPAHGYPKLRAFPHLAGNYGGAWMDQAAEFDAFPGAIVMTSNCIQRPRTYQDRIFTCGPVAWPGVEHIANRDFTPAIEAALRAPGFEQDGPDAQITVGFGRNAVMSVAGKVIDAVKSGAVRHFFLIGGCDGARPGRNYYTELAQAVPQDCIILTLACGKYRFNKLDFGTVDGLPRLLDIGQCNDAYSAIQIAVALANAFGCGVNDLPLSLILSWYEQKAVAILLTLLHLGVRNIRIGPTLPAFLSPAVLNFLVEKFNLMPVTTVEGDLAAILG